MFVFITQTYKTKILSFTDQITFFMFFGSLDRTLKQKIPKYANFKVVLLFFLKKRFNLAKRRPGSDTATYKVSKVWSGWWRRNLFNLGACVFDPSQILHITHTFYGHERSVLVNIPIEPILPLYQVHRTYMFSDSLTLFVHFTAPIHFANFAIWNI